MVRFMRDRWRVALAVSICCAISGTVWAQEGDRAALDAYLSEVTRLASQGNLLAQAAANTSPIAPGGDAGEGNDRERKIDHLRSKLSASDRKQAISAIKTMRANAASKRTAHDVTGVSPAFAVVSNAVDLAKSVYDREIALLSSNTALLVIFGGFFDDHTDNVESWAKPMETSSPYPNTEVHYFSWVTRENTVRKLVEEHVQKYPEAPVVVVGHSYGGDTAREVLKSLNPTSVQLYVTLDAVSRTNTLAADLFGGYKPKNVNRWVNLWVEWKPTADNFVALAGGHWKSQKEADVNIKRGDLTHASSRSMFFDVRVQSEIKAALKTTVDRSSTTE